MIAVPELREALGLPATAEHQLAGLLAAVVGLRESMTYRLWT